MNTRVKIGIASTIVAALVALIALDQKTAPAPSAKSGPAGDPPTITISSQNDRAPLREDEGSDLVPARRGVQGSIGLPTGETPIRLPIKETEPLPGGKEISPLPAAPQEYVIQKGDTYEEIADKKLGNRNLWKVIADANPAMKPNAMRVGKKIVIPSQPEKRAETTEVAVAGAGPRTYVVQPGDSLTAISKKMYGTIRNFEKIFQANRDKLESSDDLKVGMTLTIPEAAAPRRGGVADTSAAAAPAPAPPAPVNGKVHTVADGEKLWLIAERYRGDRGVLQMIEAIVAANSDKIKSADDLLRVGWGLLIPE